MDISFCKNVKKKEMEAYMRIIEPSFKFMEDIDGNQILMNLERYGRTCYKSEKEITPQSAEDFVALLVANGHESVLEHEKVTVKIVCDRGVTHEIVRHRLASYSQESTRYCNYSKDKFGNELTFIKPFFWNKDEVNYQKWFHAMKYIEETYMFMIRNGAKPEEARTILPNSLKTEIVVTMNLREWRHFFKLRCDKTAHPQMREIAYPMLCIFKKTIPVVFDDIEAEAFGEQTVVKEIDGDGHDNG
jgi:thymidylate synthase (FAD)